MFFLGDKLSHKIKELKHDGEFLSPIEILEQTNIASADISGEVKLKEIIMPSKDDRSEEEFIDNAGILIPAKSLLFQKWPQSCDQDRLEITFFSNIIGKRREYWGRIEHDGIKPIIWFEAVRDDFIPWTDINLIPERTIDEELYSDLTQNIFNNLPKDMAFASYQIKQDAPMVYYTIKGNNTAHTIADVGCSQWLSQYLLNIFDIILNDNLFMLFSNATKNLDMLRNPNFKEYAPILNLFEENLQHEA